jgi:hypothetical protein
MKPNITKSKVYALLRRHWVNGLKHDVRQIINFVWSPSQIINRSY